MKQFKSFFFKTLLASLVLTQFTTACIRVKKEPEVKEKKFVNLESFHVVGYSLKTSFEDEKHTDDIEKLWAQLEENFDALLFHSRADDNIYVVMFNYKKQGMDGFEVLFGYKVKNPPANLKSKYASIKIPTSNYFSKKVDGTNEEDVLKTWENIIESVPERNFKYDFEVYSFDDEFEISTIEIFTSVDDK